MTHETSFGELEDWPLAKIDKTIGKDKLMNPNIQLLPEFSSRVNKISTKQSTIDWQTDKTVCTAAWSSHFNI